MRAANEGFWKGREGKGREERREVIRGNKEENILKRRKKVTRVEKNVKIDIGGWKKR